MASVRTRNLSCKVHPLAVASILDAYIRRQEGNEKCLGALMGYIEGNCLVISDAFAVLHKENEETSTLSLDKEYHRKMVALKKKVCPTENVVGWFATCDEIEPSFVLVQNFFSTPAESRFVPTQLLPSPVLLTVDPTLSNGDLNIRVSMMQSTVGADSLIQFHQLPVEYTTETMSFLESCSEIVARDSCTSVRADLETIIDHTPSADDQKLGEAVSLALQQWRNAAAGGSDKSVQELKELAQTHLSLVKRVSAVVKDNTQEIVI